MSSSFLIFLASLHDATVLAAKSDGILSANRGWIAAAMSAITLLWAVVFLGEWIRRRRRRPTGAPIDLFEELCDAHLLNRNERKVLAAIAGTASLVNASIVFVDPRWLQRAASSGTPEAALAENLLVRLFGNPVASPHFTADPIPRD